jgi:type IV pilus assembly protein PilN
MIRINLVGPERTKKDKRPDRREPSAPGALQSYLLLALFAGGAALLCAALWWVQSNKIKQLDTQIATAEKRQRDLQAIKQQVDEFEQKKAILKNKVETIENLRLAQKSPVHMLDEISKSLPDYVWLTGLDETKGALRFAGQGNSLAAVADFISALQRSGWFPTVDLATAQEQASLVTFTLSGSFKDPEIAAREREKAAQAAAAPPAARPGPAAR